MTQQKWTAADLPAMTGRTVVVTGTSSGLGLITARQLASAGAGRCSPPAILLSRCSGCAAREGLNRPHAVPGGSGRKGAGRAGSGGGPRGWLPEEFRDPLPRAAGRRTAGVPARSG
jgi:hypothetical protein